MTDLRCDASNCPFEGEPQDRRENVWHLDRRIGLDVIISFLVMLFAGIAYVIHQDTRVTKVEDRASTLETADVRIEKALSVQKDDLVKKVDRIEDKVDQILAERRSGAR